MSTLMRTLPRAAYIVVLYCLSHRPANTLLTCSVMFCSCLTESIDILLDVYNSNRDAQHYCLLVLRNLCFFGPSKSLLASNGTTLLSVCMHGLSISFFNLWAENFLSVMSSALDCWPSDKKHVSLATSALWALLYNSAKVHMHLVH